MTMINSETVNLNQPPLQQGAVQQLAGLDHQSQAMRLAVAQIKQKLSHMYT